MANKLQLKRAFSHADEQDGSRFIVETAVAARRGQIRIGRRCMARRGCAKPKLSRCFITIPNAGMNSAGGFSLS